MSNGREIVTYARDGSGAWVCGVNDDWRDVGDWMENIVDNTFHSYREMFPEEIITASKFQAEPCGIHVDLVNTRKNDVHTEIQLSVAENKDIDFIFAQTDASRAEAIQAYIEENKDTVSAILKLVD